MTLVFLSKTLNHDCFVKSWEGSALCSATKPLVDDIHAYILTDCEGVTLFQPQE